MLSKVEEADVRKLIYEELNNLFRHVSTEMAKASDTAESMTPHFEVFLKLLSVSVRNRYMDLMRP